MFKKDLSYLYHLLQQYRLNNYYYEVLALMSAEKSNVLPFRKPGSEPVAPTIDPVPNTLTLDSTFERIIAANKALKERIEQERARRNKAIISTVNNKNKGRA